MDMPTHLKNQWDFERNLKFTPETISLSSKTKVWWLCDLGHSWSARMDHRMRKSNCPVCAGRTILVGYNDLTTLYPNVASEWHSTKNGNRMPNQFSSKSDFKPWWECAEGHEWQIAIKHRTAGTGCRRCKNNQPKLSTVAIPVDLIVEWDLLKNSVCFNDALKSRQKQYWWICDKGHSYQTRLANKLRHRGGCLVCINKVIQVGVNDLGTTHPEYAKTLDNENNIFTAQDVTYGSRKVANWLCEKGHRSRASIKDRVTKNYGCPSCKAVNSASAAEFKIRAFLEEKNVTFEFSRRNILTNNKKMELDILFKIGTDRYAIEFNGDYYHSSIFKEKDYHSNKYKYATSDGIRLINIWEHDWNDNPTKILNQLEKLILGEKIVSGKQNLVIMNGSFEEYLYDLAGYDLVCETLINKISHETFELYGAGYKEYRRII